MHSFLDINAYESRALVCHLLNFPHGMPIHINGYFELSSNRRDIWRASLPSEDSGAGKQKSDWNIALLQVRGIVLFWTFLKYV